MSSRLEKQIQLLTKLENEKIALSKERVEKIKMKEKAAQEEADVANKQTLLDSRLKSEYMVLSDILVGKIK